MDDLQVIGQPVVGGSGLVYRKPRSSSDSVYVPTAWDFDGTNDYMTRGAGLTGAADSKLVTGWFWLDTDIDPAGYVMASSESVGGGAGRFRMQVVGGNALQIVAFNGAGTVILNVATSASSITAAAGYQCLLFSFDMVDTAKRHIYIGDTADLSVTTYTDDTIDFTAADWSVGAQPNGSTKINGKLSSPCLAPGYYVDWSVESNRRQVITAGGYPAKSNADALTALSVTALINLEAAAASAGTNSGGGGNFTITGSLTDTTPPP